MKKERFLLLAVLAGVLMAGSVYLYGGKPQVEQAPPTATTVADAAAKPEPGQAVRVHVKGEVNTPGVYQLPADSRVIDAVQAAGGAKSDADTDKLNMAAVLKDGGEVVVPKSGAEPVASAPKSSTGKLNLNQATAEELDKLPGIGSTRAQAIVQYRDNEGRFLSIDDLKKVPGFGVKLIDQIRDKVTVE
ncbi:ComEA family DNA-binding protein [Tumebacillus permanentifrigoris]|uniref:Competence protein ComEA n=1 Tax=Tumebacillus permanentifrigoris TaxID=378543 RepID=A0A316DHE7_9BACL|nr:ComEA family DNA-binding protein [Tumebacillus permanentifrigoris]PWK16013.1 competence protein ComEA [Tumebacillus permanentifrigoris]